MLTMARFGSLGGHFLGAVSHDRCFQSNILNIHIFAHFGSVTLLNPILCEFSLNRFISSDCLACDWEDIAGQSVLYHDGTTTTPCHHQNNIPGCPSACTALFLLLFWSRALSQKLPSTVVSLNESFTSIPYLITTMAGRVHFMKSEITMNRLDICLLSINFERLGKDYAS